MHNYKLTHRVLSVLLSGLMIMPYGLPLLAAGAAIPAIKEQPQDVVVVLNINPRATFSVYATGQDNLSYQWQWNNSTSEQAAAAFRNSSVGGKKPVAQVGVFADIPGANKDSYTTGKLDSSYSGAKFRVVISSGPGANPVSVVSNEATVTIQDNTNDPVITAQPQDTTVLAGTRAIFSVSAAGQGGLSYQWQWNNKNGGAFSNIPGAINASYTTGVLDSSYNGSKFRVIVSNSPGASPVSVTSSVATVTITFAPPLVSHNLLVNYDFEKGSDPWIFYTNGQGSLTVVNSEPGINNNNAAKVNITAVGSDTKLYQDNISLEPNTAYRLSFRAKATAATSLSVRLMQPVSPYTNYGLDDVSFNLSGNWQTFTQLFTSTNPIRIDDARLMFWLVSPAAAANEYWFDDVVVEKIDPAARFTGYIINSGGKLEPTYIDPVSGLRSATNDAVARDAASNLNSIDTDRDGLPDAVEQVLGADPNLADSDGDGFNDGLEIQNSYNPLGAGKLDAAFSQKLTSQFIIQVEKQGDTWTVELVPSTSR